MVKAREDSRLFFIYIRLLIILSRSEGRAGKILRANIPSFWRVNKMAVSLFRNSSRYVLTLVTNRGLKTVWPRQIIPSSLRGGAGTNRVLARFFEEVGNNFDVAINKGLIREENLPV